MICFAITGITIAVIYFYNFLILNRSTYITYSYFHILNLVFCEHILVISYLWPHTDYRPPLVETAQIQALNA